MASKQSGNRYKEGLVPKKGLEPPRPCGHMDLNHARLPVPPLRHDLLQAGRALIILSCSNFYSTGRNIPVKHSHKDYGSAHMTRAEAVLCRAIGPLCSTAFYTPCPPCPMPAPRCSANLESYLPRCPGWRLSN